MAIHISPPLFHAPTGPLETHQDIQAYPACRRRKLHIPRFRSKGRKLAHSAAPPLPTGPASLGSGGSPGVSSAEPQNRSKSARNPLEGPGPLSDSKPLHPRPHREPLGVSLLPCVLLIHFPTISCGGDPACAILCGRKRRQWLDVVVVVALPPASVAAHLLGCHLADESAIRQPLDRIPRGVF